MIRTSFSQNNMFDSCPRQWYFQYIKKIPYVSDMCYAHAGSVVHTILESHYTNKKPIEEWLFARGYKFDQRSISDYIYFCP